MKNTSFRKLACGSLVFVSLLASGSASVQAQYADSSAAAAAEVRFQQLEKEIRRLTGQVEEQNFKIQQLQEELSRQTGDIQVRMNDLEGRGGGASAGGSSGAQQIPVGDTGAPYNVYTDNNEIDAPPPPDDGDMTDDTEGSDQSSSFYTPPDSTPSAEGQLGTLNQSPETGEISRGNGEAAEYETAYALIKSRDFAAAEQAFEAFIAKYPSSSYMTNAKYWYGETFYVRGDYERAARIFAESYQANPKGSKAAGNLLKLGMSLAGMGKKDDACTAFKQLKKDYASSAVPVLKRADTEMKRIGCR